MLPHLTRILKEYDTMSAEMPIPVLLKQQLAGCLLAASRFLDNSWKKDCMRRTKALLETMGDNYLKAWAVQREAAIIRLGGSRKDSQGILEGYLRESWDVKVTDSQQDLPSSSECWNAQRGELIVSYAENLVQDGELDMAERELKAWAPLDHEKRSTMECLVLRSAQTILGRIMRDQGKFEQSLSYFELLHEDTLLDQHYDHTGQRRIILSNIADLYCEVNRAKEAIPIVQAELDYMVHKNNDRISSGRRLQVCLAEAYICLGKDVEAREALMSCQKALDDLPQPDILAKNTQFRVWYGHARLAHVARNFEEARKYWIRALEAAQTCGWKEGYPANIARYSLGHALLELGESEVGLSNVEAAEENLKKDGMKYWTVGIGTYWYYHVRQCLQQVHPVYQVSTMHLS
jgi:tetratricopeptide (TPR) repeat protein